MSQIRIDKDLEDAIYDYMIAVLDATFGAGKVSVIWDKQIADSENNQSPPRPTLPYVTLNISSLPVKEGNAEIKYKELDTFSMPMRKSFTLSANAFSKATVETTFGYYNIIEAIVNGLELESFMSILRKAGLAIRGNDAPIDLSELLETVFELRAGVDIFLAYSKVVDDVTGQIDKVHLEGTIGSHDVSQDIPQT